MISQAIPERVGVTTRSAEQTRAFAAALASRAQAGDRIELLGELGAGKTQFAKGFAHGLGVREVVNSPSFTLMAEYRGRLPLFHLDLYRLGGAEDAVGAGFLDERRGDGVTLIEWAERVAGTFDSDALVVRFTILPDGARGVALDDPAGRYARYVELARTLGEHK